MSMDDEVMENFTMRIPKALRRRIHAEAERDHRSDSQMGRILIEESLAARELTASGVASEIEHGKR